MSDGDDKKPEAEPPTPGNLWEWAEDVCQVCGAHIGAGVRWLHLGLCDTCRERKPS